MSTLHVRIRIWTVCVGVCVRMCMRAGVSVWQARYESGAQLADQAPVDVDVVSNVPESANPAAQGYAERVCRHAHRVRRML